VRLLYKEMIREAGRFQDFNYRNYFIRRIRHDFDRSYDLSSQEDIDSAMSRGKKQLDMIKRQAVIGQLFDPHTKLYLEETADVKK